MTTTLLLSFVLSAPLPKDRMPNPPIELKAGLIFQCVNHVCQSDVPYYELTGNAVLETGGDKSEPYSCSWYVLWEACLIDSEYILGSGNGLKVYALEDTVRRGFVNRIPAHVGKRPNSKVTK